MASATIFKYPLDLRGTSPGNKVINEIHTIGTRTNRIFAPDYGPIFGNATVLRDVNNGNRRLVPTVDYDLLHLYREAEARTGQPVYAAILIKNPDVGVRIAMETQYVGGEFSYSYYAIIEAIRSIENDPRPVYWGELIGVPAQFPPTPHEHSIYNTYGWKTMVDAVADCTAAIREAGVANQRLLFQQMQQMRDEFVDLAMTLGDCFEQGAYELSLL